MIQITKIKNNSDLESWREQWLNAFHSQSQCDLSASYHQLATEFSHLNQSSSKELLIAHNGPALAGAMLIELKEKNIFGALKIQIIMVGGLFASDILIAPETPSDELINVYIKYIQENYPKALWINFERTSHGQYEIFKNWKKSTSYPCLSANSSKHSIFDVAEGNFENYFSSLSKNARNKIRRFKRQLAKDFENVEASSITPESQEENLDYFERFLAIENSGWKGEESGSILKRPFSYDFHKQMVISAHSKKQMSWFVLRAGNKDAAMLFILHRNDKAWVCKTAFNDKFSEYSPGAIILTDYLSHAFENNALKTIDLVTDYDWHNKWRPLKQQYYSIRIFRRSLLSFLMYANFKRKKELWSKL